MVYFRVRNRHVYAIKERSDTMSANKPRSPRNFFIIWAIFGLSLVLLSSHITSGPYAKYSSQSTGSDGARVIKFGDLTVTETGDFTSVGTNENQFIFVPGVDLKKNVLVTFAGSEASTIVFITVETPGWTLNNKSFTDSKGQLAWSVDDGWNYLRTDGSTHVFYYALDPNEKMTNTPFIKDGEIQVSENGTVAMYRDYPETSFTIQGYVVQANKFANASEAWASISSKS